MIATMSTTQESIVPESLRCRTMTVEAPRFDEASGRLALWFRFDEEDAIQETIVFPGGPFVLEENQKQTVSALALMLGVVASTSYFKARLPEAVRVSGAFGEHGLALVRAIFREGLGEFAYRNGLEPIEPRFEFEGKTAAVASAETDRSGSWLVAIGGGKDSVVAMEMLKQAGQPARAACVGSYPAVRECASIAGLELIGIERNLAERLAAWNAAGAPNGHVPVSAINSLILLIVASLRGDRGVVMANERSADEPTLSDEVRTVNHQYSKSWAFEQVLRAWLQEEVGNAPEYFSLLRPLSELEVCRRFAAMPEYHGAFVSCNAAYRRDPDRRANRWCCDCPKCRFVFVALAPFVRPSDLVEIFGADLLGDASQATGFSDLLNKEARPFECVGTRAEVRAAFGLLRSDPNWREAPVVQAVAAEYGITPFRLEHAKGVLAPSGEHAIAPELASKLGL